MHKITRNLAGAAAAVALLIGSGGAAEALTTNTGFRFSMPAAQQTHNFSQQEKVRPGVSSNIEFFNIGSSYAMNAKAQNMQTGKEYTERKDLGRNIIYNLRNSTPKGQMTRIRVTNSKWALVTVYVRGWYRTN